MKALRKLKAGPGNVQLVEVDVPVPGQDEVLVEVKRGGVCGTDIHILHDTFSRTRPPVTLCHEFCGVVMDMGRGVKHWKVGDRVTSETEAYSCGDCLYCRSGQSQLCEKRQGFGYARDGAFASYITVPERLLHRLPDHVSFREGALAEPLAVATHVVMQRSSLKAGEVALVTGPGTIGLLVLQVAKALGAIVVVTGLTQDQERLCLARNLGANHCFKVDEEDLCSSVRHLTNGYGVDLAYECTGSPSGVQNCIESVRRGGEIVQVGLLPGSIELGYNDIVFKELHLKGSFAHNRESWKRAINLLEDHKVNLGALISGEYPLEEWERAFQLFEEGKGLKYLLYPSTETPDRPFHRLRPASSSMRGTTPK